MHSSLLLENSSPYSSTYAEELHGLISVFFFAYQRDMREGRGVLEMVVLALLCGFSQRSQERACKLETGRRVPHVWLIRNDK